MKTTNSSPNVCPLSCSICNGSQNLAGMAVHSPHQAPHPQQQASHLSCGNSSLTKISKRNTIIHHLGLTVGKHIKKVDTRHSKANAMRARSKQSVLAGGAAFLFAGATERKMFSESSACTFVRKLGSVERERREEVHGAD